MSQILPRGEYESRALCEGPGLSPRYRGSSSLFYIGRLSADCHDKAYPRQSFIRPRPRGKEAYAPFSHR